MSVVCRNSQIGSGDWARSSGIFLQHQGELIQNTVLKDQQAQTVTDRITSHHHIPFSSDTKLP